MEYGDEFGENKALKFDTKTLRNHWSSMDSPPLQLWQLLVPLLRKLHVHQVLFHSSTSDVGTCC